MTFPCDTGSTPRLQFVTLDLTAVTEILEDNVGEVRSASGALNIHSFSQLPIAARNARMICACSNGSAETHQLNVSYRRPATSTKGDLLVKKSLARIGSSHRGSC